MSVWSRIAEAVQGLAQGAGLTALLERFRAPPERSVAFTIAVIALGAKMAKADGRVTRDEVAAFREVFTIPEASRRSAAMLFDYARQDVAGFEEHAARIGRMFGPGSDTLHDLMDGLLHIAAADGEVHPGEDAFLSRCAELFGLDPARYARQRAQTAGDDPWAALGLEPGADPQAVRARWRALVRETHPDRLIARGLPEEAVRLATARLARINEAYERIAAEG